MPLLPRSALPGGILVCAKEDRGKEGSIADAKSAPPKRTNARRVTGVEIICIAQSLLKLERWFQEFELYNQSQIGDKLRFRYLFLTNIPIRSPPLPRSPL